MKQHTNEPWHAAEITRDSDTFVKICHANGGTIAKLWIDVDDSDFSDGQRADARRIVACVNACEGVDTELLEEGELDNPVMKIVKEKSELKQQCDELLAALEEVHRIASGSNMTHNMMVIRDHCADAIAKAKGGAA